MAYRARKRRGRWYRYNTKSGNYYRPRSGWKGGNVTAPSKTTQTVTPPSGPTARPSNAQYTGTIADINQQLVNTKAKLAAEESDTKRSYGFDDTSNPYSRAKLLENSYNTNKLATNTSLASQGQLYSGAMTNAQNFNTTNYTTSRGQLREDYDSRLRDIIRRGTAAESSASTSRTSAEAQRLEDDLSQPAEDPGAPYEQTVKGIKTLRKGRSRNRYKYVRRRGKLYRYNPRTKNYFLKKGR